MKHHEFTGTGVALVTPFRQNGSVDFDALKRIMDFNIENGVRYFVVLGTTGESATLDPDEKKLIWNTVAEHNDGRVPLVAGIGGNNTKSMTESLRQFDIPGYKAVLSVSPYYNKPQQEGIYQHYMRLAEVSSLPIIIYNVPGRTGSNITAETCLRLASAHDGFIGVKEASGNFSQIMQIVKSRPKGFLVISGDDLITLPLMSFGCDGVISVVAQAFPAAFSEMVSLAQKGEFRKATQKHEELLDYMEWLFAEGSPSGVKAALHLLGLCENVVRLPLVPVSETLYQKLRTALKPGAAHS